MIPNKKSQLAICLSFVLLTVLSCKKENKPAETPTKNKLDSIGLPPPIIFWARGADLNFGDGIPGDVAVGRIFSHGFTINGKGYICAGNAQTSNGPGSSMRDLWEYDPLSRTWTKKADYPGFEPIEGVNFVIGDNAYICYKTELWQYNQPSNTWTRKADFPSSVVRTLCTGMAINGKGYVGLGTHDVIGSPNMASTKDWWSYDPVADSWTRMADFPGGRRGSAVGFVINGKGYVCAGHNWAFQAPDGNYNDLWQYNPATDSWKQKADFPGLYRVYAVGMSAQNFGFVMTGQDINQNPLNDAWQYSPANDTWYQFPTVGGGGRLAASGFAIDNTLYIGQGTVGILSGNYKKDFWGLTLPTP